jgi:hypothetical protein
MRKEMPVIPVNRVVDAKRIIGKRRAEEEEEWHKGLLTPQKTTSNPEASFLKERSHLSGKLAPMQW